MFVCYLHEKNIIISDTIIVKMKVFICGGGQVFCDVLKIDLLLYLKITISQIFNGSGIN